MPSVAVASTRASTRPIGCSTVAVVRVGPLDLPRFRSTGDCKHVDRPLCARTFEDLDHPIGSSNDQRAYDYFGSWPDLSVAVAGGTRPVQDLGCLRFLRHLRDLGGQLTLQDLPVARCGLKGLQNLQ